MMHIKPLRFDLNKKQGQFYLIAAIVIISILVGFVSIRNFTSQNQIEEEKVFFLKDELGFESAQVIDYGIIKNAGGASGKTTPETLTAFADEYSSYAGDGRNLYFVYGNAKDGFYVAGWEDVVTGSLSLNTGTDEVVGVTLQKQRFKSERATIGGLGDDVDVTVVIEENGEEVAYPFTLKQGEENFFFVVRQQVGDDTVAVNSEEDIVQEHK